MAELTTDLGFLRLKNPIIPASGTFGYGIEFGRFFDLNLLGAMVLKGVYWDPRPGNPPPRIRETHGGLLNSIGLAGPGAEKLAPIVRQLAAQTTTPIIINVCGANDDEYLNVAGYFDLLPEVAALELNISCPNVKANGRCPALDDRHTYRLVKKIRDAVKKPLLVKLSPNAPQVVDVATAAESAGADGLSVANTLLGLAVDVASRKPVFKNFYAGYSGPAIKPLILKLVWEVTRAVSIPVIGIGGIVSGQDVLEYILAGAHAIQTGTINLIEPAASVRILNELHELARAYHITDLTEIRGKLKP